MMGIDIGLFIGGFIGVFTFFYKLVILPLSEAINELKRMIAELRADIRAERDKRNEIDKRVSVLEEKVKHLEDVVK